MKVQQVQISKLVIDPEFRDFYSSQSNEDLRLAIEAVGLRHPISVDRNNVVVDGIRRVEVYWELGISEIPAIISAEEGSLIQRVQLNTQRKKTVEDEIKEVRLSFKSYPKQQGKRPKGQVHSREEVLSMALNGRWKDTDSLNKLEFVINNDFPDESLLKGILKDRSNLAPSYEYLTKWKVIDEEKKYGFTQSLCSGEVPIKKVNQLIQNSHSLDTKYKHSFVIPDKVNAYNYDCINLAKMEEHRKTVDLIFTSPPYYILRNYRNGQAIQLGQEKTKEEYCLNIATIFRNLEPLLKDSANVMINIGETYDNGVGYGIPQLLKEYIEKHTSFIYKDQIVWSKTNPKPQNETVKRLINNVEYILWFVVDPKKAKYNMLTYPSKSNSRKLSKGVKDVDKNGVIWDKTPFLTNPYKKLYTHLEEQTITSIIKSSAGQNHEIHKIIDEAHPAIMCGVLPVVPILMCSDEGDTVLDPFAATCVVGRMALLLNRRALLAEISPKYFQLGCEVMSKSEEDFNKTDLDFINSIIYEDKNSSNQIAA